MKSFFTSVLIMIGVLLFGYNNPCLSNTPSSIHEGIPTKFEIKVERRNNYLIVNGNCPFFTLSEKSLVVGTKKFSKLDPLLRCGPAMMVTNSSLLPKDKRGPIGMVKPTGWHLVKYDFVDRKYLYNRCHLLGYQLSGENANPLNLITGTRYLNVKVMLPFENKVIKYLRRTGKSILYRVTPIFYKNELLARGVLMEAYSVDDEGKYLQFNVFCPNVQPGVVIDYSTGSSMLDINYKMGLKFDWDLIDSEINDRYGRI